MLIGAGSRASIFETFAGRGSYWRNDVVELRLAEGAELARVGLVEEAVLKEFEALSELVPEAKVIALLAIVTASYRQTLYAYPSGGGSYIVSRENLGTGASLTAAAALMVDYTLTVSVSIAAGVASRGAAPSPHVRSPIAPWKSSSTLSTTL